MKEGLIRSRGRVGMRLCFADGTLARVYRETVVDRENVVDRGPTLDLRTSPHRYHRLPGNKRSA